MSQDDGGRSRGEIVVESICGQRTRIPLYLSMIAVMGLFLALSMLYVDPSENPIVVIDAILVVVAFVGLAGTYWYCTRREMEARRANGDA